MRGSCGSWAGVPVFLDRRRMLAWVGLTLAMPWDAFATPTGVTSSGRSINEWLGRLHEATRQRSFVGTLVVSAGSSMSASKIWHVCDGEQQVERIDTLTGTPRTTIRRNQEVVTFVPEAKVARVERRDSLGAFPDLLRTPNNRIPDFYAVHERGSERVAGHLADVIDILPADGQRFGYRIWSERKTGLAIKLQTLDGTGGVLEQVAFTELQLDAPVSMARLKDMMANTRGYQLQKPVQRKVTPDVEGWRLGPLVAGFSAVGCHLRGDERLPAGRSPMQCVFSDGLASVSLFVETYDPARHVSQDMMAVEGSTHTLTRRLGEHWLTVVGEVPAGTLKQFAQSLERVR